MSLQDLYKDAAKYKDMLDALITGIEAGPRLHRQLGVMSQTDRLRLGTHVLPPKYSGGRMDLVYPPQTPDEEPEEFVMKVQGYLVHAKLPPIVSSVQLGPNVATAKQSVTISGLGSAAFNRAVLATELINNRFREQCVRQQMNSVDIRRERGFPVLTFSNRYLTTTNADGNDQLLTITDDIDPLQILRNAMKSDGVYTGDNVVSYYERMIGKDGKTEYIGIPPSTIHIGQLVEVQMGFCAVSVKNGKYTMLSKLRSVCILDRSLEKAHNDKVLDLLANTGNGSNRRTIKRKVGYDSDDEILDPSKLMRLDIRGE